VKPYTPAIDLPRGIDRAAFLRDYWQKKPLLMRSAMSAKAFSLTPDELAGLACEAEFESRLIIEHPDSAWEVRHGPFAGDDFATLPESHWTLLVQDVDKYLPDVARLMEGFDFVPTWRIDDIMISYASDQGGVGPHTDAYDVFLMQAAGRRRWRLSFSKYTDDDLIPGLDQRILSHFRIDEEWVLEPGDVLYLPPGIAHWGIAEGECMTYSLGFRAPSQQDLAADWFQHLVSLADARRLIDPADLQLDSLAELSEGAHEEASKLLDTLPSTRSTDYRLWLGEYLTEPKPQFHILPPDEAWSAPDLDGWLAQGRDLSRHPFARMTWSRLGNEEVVLFSQGESRRFHGEMTDAVRLIAERRQFGARELGRLDAPLETLRDLLLELLNAGILEPQQED